MGRKSIDLGDISDRIWDARVWDKCNALISVKGSCSYNDIRAFATSNDIDIKGAFAEFQAWKRYNGLEQYT